MNKWIAEFDLEDGDTMLEHMDLEYNGGKIDFHCRPMWIPCSEKQPEESGEYFVSVIDNSGEDIDYEAVGVAWFAHKKDYNIKESEWRELGINEKVIAWMPKPKPYKPQESEEQLIMLIKFIKDFANNWKAGDIVKAKYLEAGEMLVDDVAKIDAKLLLKHCKIISESENP